MKPAILRLLRRGGVIAYPTEAVYGLGCDPRNRAAVQRLLALKRRSWKKGLILIAADFSQLQPFIRPLSAAVRARIMPTWPGPVTWLLPARSDVPRWLRGQSSKIAVRVTAHPPVVRLCRAFGGALVSTSANRSGQPPARQASEVRRQFGAELDYILPGATGGRLLPSAIRDGLSGEVARAG
jgi:L-threonylcarbamoyladenylate synthase